MVVLNADLNVDFVIDSVSNKLRLILTNFEAFMVAVKCQNSDVKNHLFASRADFKSLSSRFIVL